MTFIGKLLAADPRRAGRRAKHLAVVGSLVAVTVCFAPGGAASGDPVGDTQGQIAALQSQITAGAGQIHQLTQAYEQANLQASSLAQQLASDNATLSSMQATVGARQQSVSNAAVNQYTGGQLAATDTLADLGQADPAVRDVYLEVATGNVDDSVDALKVAQGRLEQERQVVTTEQKQAQDAVRSAATARSQALALATTEQNRLTQLQAELAQQVAAQQAAQAQAAANQAAAAQAAAARAAAASHAQGAPVNNGLVDTVQAVVGPAPSSAPAPATPAPATPTTTPASGGGGAGGVWAELRQCESGGNYQENTGNGFYGAYQFSAGTWTGLGYPGRPDQEPPAMQDQAAQQLQARSGWGQWPACSAALGLT